MENSYHSVKPTSSPIAFFGTAQFSAPSLEALLEAGYDIGLVVTKPDRAQGRGRKHAAPPIKEIAQKHNIPLIQPTDKHEVSSHLASFSHITLGVVVAYGMILPSPVLDHFSTGLINAHASLLPRWRGPSPIEAAILHGDSRTGVSLMELAPEMDTGDIYIQTELALDQTETRPQIYKELAQLSAETLVAHLGEIARGEIAPTSQDEAVATYTGMIRKADGVIDWNQSAKHIERHVRAYLGWPGSRTRINNRDVIVTCSRTENVDGPSGKAFTTDTGELAVYCGSGALIIEELIPAGKSAMSGTAFLAGNPI